MTHPLHHFHTPNPKAMRTTSPMRIAMLFSRRGGMTQFPSSRGGVEGHAECLAIGARPTHHALRSRAGIKPGPRETLSHFGRRSLSEHRERVGGLSSPGASSHARGRST
jgi:hypothetical protein